MLRGSDIDRMAHVVDQSGAVDMIDAILRGGKKKAGRPSPLSTRTLLIGMLLSAYSGDGLILTSIYRILTLDIPIDKQLDLGVRSSITSDPLFAQDTIDRAVNRIIKALQFGQGAASDLTDEQREERQHQLLSVINAMIDVTLEPIPITSTLSIDTTSVWAFGRNPGKKDVAAVRESIAELRATGNHEEADNLQRQLHMMIKESASSTKRRGNVATLDDAQVQDFKVYAQGYDPDARSSAKTGKDGTPEWVYGFDVHATVRTVNPGDPHTSVPNLVERVVVSPAGRDLIRSSQLLITSAPAVDLTRTILGDRAYSNLVEDNWYFFLAEHGYEQAVDMREDNQAWTDVDGMRVTAGSCHCPSTPDHLEKIPRPNFGADEEFCELVAERQQYAAYVKESTPTQRRLVCPALAGQVRCPLRPETLALPVELPLIENPPHKDTAPAICTQQSVTVHANNPNARARLWQRHYWGSRKQIQLYNARTSIEQKFSRVKDRHGTNMSKGFVRVAGLTAMTLAVGLVFIASNVRDLETWANRHADLSEDEFMHPLLASRDESVHLELTRSQADEFAEYLRHRQQRDLPAA